MARTKKNKASIKATSKKQDSSAGEDEQEKKAKVPYLLLLRVSFAQALAKAFKGKAGWTLPEEAKITDTKAKDTHFEVKNKSHGCNFTLHDETANFYLKDNTKESIEALNQTLGAYVSSYDKWLAKCKEQKVPAKDRDLIFDLTVYDENDIKPLVEALAKTGHSFSKIIVVNPETNEEKQLTTEEIAAFSPQAKQKQKATG